MTKLIQGMRSIQKEIPDAKQQMETIWTNRMSEGYVDETVFRNGLVVAVIDDDKVIAFAGGKVVNIRSVHKELTQGELSSRFGDCVRENNQVGVL